MGFVRVRYGWLWLVDDRAARELPWPREKDRILNCRRPVGQFSPEHCDWPTGPHEAEPQPQTTTVLVKHHIDIIPYTVNLIHSVNSRYPLKWYAWFASFLDL